MEKHNVIGVFFGGRNPEHEISIITGQMIISELRKLKYPVVPVYIDRRGRMFSDEDLGFLKFFTHQDFETKLDMKDRWLFELSAENKGIVLKTGGVFAKKKRIDIAFPAFHGMNGEDGTFQGVFELCNVPYVGCGVASSALAMDKILTKQLYASEGIQTTPFMYFSSTDWDNDRSAVLEKAKQLHWPLFVKPARLGSSIGIAKVKSHEEFINACEVALHYDNRVIVEESVNDLMDVTCAVLGNSSPEPSLVQESVFQGEHFSYESKYIEDGGAQLGASQKNIIIPARLSKERAGQVKDLSIKIFKLFDCSGIARVDFLYDKGNDVLYANEVNTLPGTLYHHLWKASGVGIGDLLERLLDFAIAKHAEKNDCVFSFKSAILSQAHSIKLQIKNAD